MYKYMLSVLLAFCFIFSNLQAAKIDEIIAKSLEASGSDKAKTFNTIKTTGKISVMGQEVSVTIFTKKPKKFRLEQSSAMVSGFIVMNDTVAWASQGGLTQDIPLEAAQNQLEQTDFTKNMLQSMKEKGDTLALAGRETIDDKDCYKITAKTIDGNNLTIFVDSKDYLIYKMKGSAEQQGQTTNIDVSFLDYKVVEGMKIPFKVAIDAGMMKLDIIYEKVETNVDVPDALFEKPAK